MHWRMAAHRAEKELARLKAQRTEFEVRARGQAYGAERSLLPPH
jgi:hypothetical protein